MSAPIDSVKALLKRTFGGFKLAYLPVLITYFAYGASGITAVALLYFQKETLHLTPAEVARIAFWVGLPWAMKMVVGVASDRMPIFGGKRKPYLLLGTALSAAGYAALATVVDSKAGYLAATVMIAVGFMIQDVIADALSVEIAENDEDIAQIQTLGRVALLAGTISVGYLSGVLAGTFGPRRVCAFAVALPVLVAIAGLFARLKRETIVSSDVGPLAGGNAALILICGTAYAIFSVGLEAFGVADAQEIVVLVSAALISLLFWRLGISRAVIVAALVIFLFRSTPSAGQGYNYWAIDELGFDEEFLGILAQVGAVLSLVGLLVFRKPITERPVSFTLFWVIIAATILYLPNIGLFYGIHEWLGVTPRLFALIDTTVSAPLGQLTMVPMLVLIARTAPAGAEATMFAIMASLMNLALSTAELFTRSWNTFYNVTQEDYSNLGRLMITVAGIGLLPLFALPVLRRYEREISHHPATERR